MTRLVNGSSIKLWLNDKPDLPIEIFLEQLSYQLIRCELKWDLWIQRPDTSLPREEKYEGYRPGTSDVFLLCGNGIFLVLFLEEELIDEVQ